MAQGYVNFVTKSGTTVDAKVTHADTGAAVGTDFLATLYWGTSKDSLQPAQALVAGVPVALAKAFLASGYVNNGKTVISGAAEESLVWLQVRAWDGTKGATYDAAKNALGKIGESNIIQVKLGGGQPPSTPPFLTGVDGTKLAAFTVAPIPEPSIIALGLLGGAALLLRRRS